MPRAATDRAGRHFDGTRRYAQAAGLSEEDWWAIRVRNVRAVHPRLDALLKRPGRRRGNVHIGLTAAGRGRARATAPEPGPSRMRDSITAVAAGGRVAHRRGRSAETEDAMTYPQYPGQPGPQQPYPGQPYPGQSPQQPFPGQPGAQQPYPGQSPHPAPSGGFPAQPYPGQPPYPGAGQPYPPAPYPAPGYGMQPPRPNGATAIIAGVLAVLGGLLYLVSVIGGVVTLASPGFPLWMAILLLVQNIVLTGTLLPGGILLFLRKPVGRVLTIIGSGLAILLSVVSVVMSAAGLWYYSGLGGMYAGAAFVGLLMVLVPAGATLVLAIVKPTARWCGRGEPGFAGYPPR